MSDELVAQLALVDQLSAAAEDVLEELTTNIRKAKTARLCGDDARFRALLAEGAKIRSRGNALHEDYKAAVDRLNRLANAA